MRLGKQNKGRRLLSNHDLLRQKHNKSVAITEPDSASKVGKLLRTSSSLSQSQTLFSAQQRVIKIDKLILCSHSPTACNQQSSKNLIRTADKINAAALHSGRSHCTPVVSAKRYKTVRKGEPQMPDVRELITAFQKLTTKIARQKDKIGQLELELKLRQGNDLLPMLAMQSSAIESLLGGRL